VTVIVNAVAAATLLLLPVVILREREPFSIADIVVGDLLSLVGFVAIR